MAGAKSEAGAPKRGGKGGQQQRETPPPAEVNVGGVQVAEETRAAADPLAGLAFRVASASAERRAELIDRAGSVELDYLAGVLKSGDGLSEVEAEIRRRRRVAAEVAGVRSQEERDEGVIWRGQASLPCPLDPSERREMGVKLAVERQVLAEKRAAMIARHKAEKEEIDDADKLLAEPQREVATGLRNALVEAEARVIGGEVVGYRLDTGAEYSRRPATDEERARAAQRSLWGVR